MKHITNRIEALRSYMRQKGIAAFITPSTDPHSGEYVPAHWESRKWISGFTGSAGTVVITAGQGGLWTDSRYFLQAAEQLQGSGLTLFKDRLPETPNIPEWLGQVLNAGDKVGIDGWVTTAAEALELKTALAKNNLELVTVEDPYETLWQDRPTIPMEKPFILPLSYCGIDSISKIEEIRRQIHENQADGILISALDEIAWTLNMRGNDVHCNPVFVSYLLITKERAVLYLLPEKLTPEIQEYLNKQQIEIQDYRNVEKELRKYSGKTIQLPATTNYALYQAAASATTVITAPSPVLYLKAIKNETEIAGFHAAMQRDGVAMVRFLKWLKESVKHPFRTAR